MFNYKISSRSVSKNLDITDLIICSLWYLDQLTYFEAIAQYNGKITKRYFNAYDVIMISSLTIHLLCYIYYIGTSS